MTTPVDINPFPLGAIAPTSGTLLSVLNNYPNLAQRSAKVLTFYAPPTNQGTVYVGSAGLVRATLTGVLLMIDPGETKALPFDGSGGNTLDLGKFYVDVDTTGDKTLADALYA